MKKVVIWLLVAGCWLLVVFSPAFAQDRFATCDLCGFCKDLIPTPPQQNPPSNWESCRRCIYEFASSDPYAYETLKINDSNLPPSPVPGRYYTVIGCIDTNLGSFQTEGAAASLVQVLLKLIFSAAGGIALLYFLYGSFLVLTSQTNPERLGQGKRTIYGAVVGIIFCFSSVFLINLLASGVLKIPGFGGGP